LRAQECNDLITEIEAAHPELLGAQVLAQENDNATSRHLGQMNSQPDATWIGEHGDVIVCGTEAHAAVVSACARSLGAPYIPFRLVFVEGLMDWHGESLEREPDSIPLTCVWCSLGDYDNIFAYRRINQNDRGGGRGVGAFSGKDANLEGTESFVAKDPALLAQSDLRVTFTREHKELAVEARKKAIRERTEGIVAEGSREHEIESLRPPRTFQQKYKLYGLRLRERLYQQTKRRHVREMEENVLEPDEESWKEEVSVVKQASEDEDYDEDYYDKVHDQSVNFGLTVTLSATESPRLIDSNLAAAGVRPVGESFLLLRSLKVRIEEWENRLERNTWDQIDRMDGANTQVALEDLQKRGWFHGGMWESLDANAAEQDVAEIEIAQLREVAAAIKRDAGVADEMLREGAPPPSLLHQIVRMTTAPNTTGRSEKG
jgi:hypothetical protein